LFETWEMLIRKGERIHISGEFKDPENVGSKQTNKNSEENHELFYKTVEFLLKEGIHINFTKEFENAQL
jgi:hypothetical protein